MSELSKALFSAFPSDRVSDDPVIIAAYATDSSMGLGHATQPSIVVMPKSLEEVVHLIQIAHRTKTPIVPMSRGSNIGGISIASQGGIIADLRYMNRIIEINKDASYAIIEPGVTLHQLGLQLKKEGFFMHLPTATGGSSAIANYLMRPSGNFTSGWDPDPILSLEVVTPGKGVIRTGSAAFENAGWQARYQCFPDLTGLFGNSYGTLGIVTKGSVKIFDRGECEEVLLTTFDNFASATEYMKLIVRRNLAQSVTFWTWGWNFFHEMMLSKEEEIPQAMLKADQKTPPVGYPFGIASARISGYNEVVDAQIHRAIKLAEELGGKHLSEEEGRRIHPGCYKYFESSYKEGILSKPGEESQIRAGMHLSGCLITAEPSKLVAVEKYMWDLAKKEFEPPYFYRALPYSHGREFFFAFVVYVRGSIIEQQPYIQHLRSIYHELYRELRDKFGGIMFRFRKDPTFLASTGNYGLVLKDIKNILAPHNIMNPGMLMF